MSLNTAFLIAMLTALLFPHSTAAEPSQRAVLVLHQWSADFPFNTALTTAIRLTLNASSKSPILFYSENLDANHFSGPEYDNAFVEFLKQKYQDKTINAAVVVGASALDFMTRRRQQIWPSVPVIFAAIDEAAIARLTLPENVTGATMQLTLQDMVKTARIVVPDLKAVAIVGDSLERQTFYRHFLLELPALKSELEIIDLMNLPLWQLEQRLVTLPAGTAVIYTGISIDGEGVSHVPAEFVSDIAKWSNRPVVVNLSSYLNKGAIGGYIVQAEPIGQQVARLLLRILDGERASDIPVAKVASPLIFEWPALQRWKISETVLPQDSEIRFRTPAFWEQYLWLLLLIAAAILAQAALIARLVYERHGRSKAEFEARRRMLELAHMNRHATAGELSASIAHEINQPLAAILSNTEAAEMVLDQPAPDLQEIKEILTEIKRDDLRASEVIRRLRRLLTKAEFQARDVDLNDTIREVFEFLHMQAAARNIVLSSVLSSQVMLVKGDRIQLQQVVLNLVVNGMDAMADPKGRERRITSRTALVDDAAEVSIADTGPGIPPDKLAHLFEPFFTTKEDGMGMGLSITRTIVEAHGGRIWAENQAAGGAVFRLRLPLAKTP